jgi:hypothetical protein
VEVVHIDAGGVVFTPQIHDYAISKIGTSDGIYLRVSRRCATELHYALENTPQAVPVVADKDCQATRAEFRRASDGQLLAEVVNLSEPVPMDPL